MRAILSGFFTLLIATLVVAVALLLYVYSGTYNVAATDESPGLVETALEVAKERSVRARAGELSITAPTDSASLQRGYQAYEQMCVICHGAPGVERGWIGQGANPEPPELGRPAGSYATEELYWIIRHGIKMTGMPALEPTHDEEEILEITAFVTRLADMSAPEYAAWGRAPADTASSGSHPGHDH